ncbi:MAG: 1-deoxy-D-xylulose-5-phosphate reductoisomerase [Phycisphaerae bacterium]
MHKRVLILGSTGSIGRSALDVVAAMPDRLRVVGLAAHRDVATLAEQAAAFDVPRIAIADDTRADELCRAAPGRSVMTGSHGLVELVRGAQADFVLSAIVGAAGLPATLAAVERGIDVGLANKESLVVAGPLMTSLARERGGKLIPVDSEHSAVFQALHAGRATEVRRIFLTASGGPFREWPRERIESATLQAALNHPIWSMGPKITIDSATMMNKALEIIEAHHLFGLKREQIQVLVHPESIVHSMVEFQDGSIIAQLGTPDMRTPIQYAMTYPDRQPGAWPALDWSAARMLRFEPPDLERFPALRLGFEAAELGGSSGAVLNAANEAAVDRFRNGVGTFGDISRVTEHVFRRHRCLPRPTLDDLLACDAWARDEVNACMTR